jgi:enamine deaminase RidA (YjgF/YER057c/UK114 family)
VPKRHLQPSELFASQQFGFSQVVESTSGRHLFLAGQGAFDKDFKLIGGTDLAAQTEQALRNIRHALAAAGAQVSDLTSLRIYVVDYKGEDMTAIGGAIGRFFEDGPPPAQTLIGVQALGLEGMRIEIEATAVVD